MKRLAVVVAFAVVAGGCAGESAETTQAPQVQGVRLGAGDALGWRLQSNDRAMMSATAEERGLAGD